MIIDTIKKNNEIVVDGELAKVNLGKNYTMKDYFNFMALREHLPRYEFEYIDDVPWLVTDKVHFDFHDNDYRFREMSKHLYDYHPVRNLGNSGWR